MTESDLKDLISSQDLNFIMADEPAISEIVNGTMGILDEEVSLPEQYNDVPSNENYPGPFNFEVFINPPDNKNWMYSSVLKKVFIISHTNFPVDFKWDHNPNQKINFYVRAMPLYNSTQDAHKPVRRCIQHAHITESSNKGLTGLSRLHIMRCSNDSAQYDGGPTSHFSVIVPLSQPQPGLDIVRHRYVFVCKNSCTTGMNRRPIEVIFTLEDEIGNILGRSTVNVRVCSCPKRDKEKEEKDFLKHDGGTPVKGKRRKIIYKKSSSSFTDVMDNGVYSVNLNVIGRNNQKAVIKYAQDRMAAEMIRYKVEEPFKKCYNEIGNIYKNLDSVQKPCPE